MFGHKLKIAIEYKTCKDQYYAEMNQTQGNQLLKLLRKMFVLAGGRNWMTNQSV